MKLSAASRSRLVLCHGGSIVNSSVDPFFVRESPLHEDTAKREEHPYGITKFLVLPGGATTFRSSLILGCHRLHSRATSDPSYLSPFHGCHYSAPGQRTLPGGPRRQARERIARAGALSSAESAAENNVYVELRGTDSSHFYVCLHTSIFLCISPCRLLPPSHSRRSDNRISRLAEGRGNIRHLRSRGRSPVSISRTENGSLVFAMKSDCAAVLRLSTLPRDI